jgi:glycerate-2-kinase
VQAVLETLEAAKLLPKIAPSFRQYLNDVAKAIVPETPKLTHPAFAHVVARVIATNTVALNAAATTARRAGLSTVVSDALLTGEASAAGAAVAAALVEARERTEPGAAHVFVWGGETTVKLNTNGAAAPPGGRCQEFALAAAQRLAEFGERARGITILSAGTDGRDGATDAAGAIVDALTWSRITQAGRDPAAALREHESYAALSAADALFSPGLTGTNVMDVTIGLVDRRQ